MCENGFGGAGPEKSSPPLLPIPHLVPPLIPLAQPRPPSPTPLPPPLQLVPGVVQSLKVITYTSSLRIAHYAFEYALLNNRKKVCVGTCAWMCAWGGWVV